MLQQAEELDTVLSEMAELRAENRSLACELKAARAAAASTAVATAAGGGGGGVTEGGGGAESEEAAAASDDDNQGASECDDDWIEGLEALADAAPIGEQLTAA